MLGLPPLAALLPTPHRACPAPRHTAALQPATGLRSARFDVVYLDEGMRITRGDRVSGLVGG